MLIVSIVVLILIIIVYNKSGSYLIETESSSGGNTYLTITGDVNVADTFDVLNRMACTLLHKLETDDTVQNLDFKNIIKLYRERYEPLNLYENRFSFFSPTTSFIVNKKDIALCVKDAYGKIHEIGTLFFVLLHEISHMVIQDIHHTQFFWEVFKTLLFKAHKYDIHAPVDFQKRPVYYCNNSMIISYNPYFDDTIPLIF